MPFSPGFITTAAVLLALLHAVLATTATVGKSITADETGYLAAGHVYNTWADYRLQPENGIFPQRWVALPLFFEKHPLPSITALSWQRSDVWRYGYEYLYSSGVREGEFLFWGRAMTSFLSAATALLIFFWTRNLFGVGPAFFSESLYTFCPAFLAHGALATSDLAITFFLLAGAGTFARCLARPTMGRIWLSAGVMGAAAVSKYSALLLLPTYLLISIIWWLQGLPRRHPVSTLGALAKIYGLHILGAALVIWLFYGFRYSAFAPGLSPASFERSWEWALAPLGILRSIVLCAREHHLMPESWLYGFAYALASTQERGAFLNGQYSLGGWVSFFPLTVLLKTTLPVLLLAGMTIIVGVRSGVQKLRTGSTQLWRWMWPYSPLLALFIVYWTSSLAAHLNIGHRHILPTYPEVFIAAGGLMALGRLRRSLGLACVAALGWQLAASSAARPNYLAYFNPLAGGTENGWRHLVDSSLDWGQDLPALADRLRGEDRLEPRYVAYFGTGNLTYEGVNANRILVLPELGMRHRAVKLTGGLYIISATLLQQVYSSVRGDWTRENEQEFTRLRLQEDQLLEAFNHHGESKSPTRSDISSDRANQWRRYEDLRLARLSYYLRARGPDETINGSLLVFHLTPADVHASVGGSLQEWIQQIETVVATKAGE